MDEPEVNRNDDRRLNDDRRWRPSHRGSLLGPLILIGIGLFFLFSNLGLIEGDAWSLILRLWPLLLIIGGLDGILRREGFVGATLMIGLGVIFLLSNYGYLALSPWQVIFNLWPLFLIAFGFDILIGRRSLIGSLVGVLLILAILAGALWAWGVSVERGQTLSGVEVRQELEGATTARVEISPGAGSLELAALAEPGALLVGTVPEGRGLEVRQDYSVSGGQGRLTLRSAGTVVNIPGRADNWEWDLGLNPEIPLELDVNMGVGSAELDLTDLDLTALDLDLGVGQNRVTLPATGSYTVKVNGAVGQTIIYVPEGLGVRVKSNTGIGNLDVPGDWEERNGMRYSPGYDSAEYRIELEVSQAIGQIRVVQR